MGVFLWVGVKGNLGGCWGGSAFWFYAFLAVEVGSEGFGNGDGSILVLIHLEDGDEDSGAGDDGVVEGMAEDGPALGISVTEVQAAALEIVEAGGGVGFAVGPGGEAIFTNIASAGHPAFDVDHVGVFRSEIAGAALEEAVGEFEFLEKFLDDRNHGLMPLDTCFPVVSGDDDLFDLVELVDAIEPGGVTPGGSGFAPEAGGKSAVFEGELVFIEDFIRMETHKTHFAGTGEVEVFAGAVAAGFVDFIGLIKAGRKKAGAEHAVVFDDDGNGERGEAVVLGDVIEGEAKDGLVEHHPGTFENVVAGATDFYAAFEIDEVEGMDEIEVGFGGKAPIFLERICRIEMEGVPGSKLDIIRLGFALWHFGIGWERHLDDESIPGHLEGGELRLQGTEFCFQGGGPGFQLLDFCFKFGSVFTFGIL